MQSAAVIPVARWTTHLELGIATTKHPVSTLYGLRPMRMNQTDSQQPPPTDQRQQAMSQSRRAGPPDSAR